MKEEWKTIEDFNDYKISNFGIVKSFKKRRELILSPINVHDYLYVSLCKNGKVSRKAIHRLVLEAFDPRKNMNELQCNHINGDKKYNIFPENIEWCTSSENLKHAYKIGLKIPMKGKKNPMFGKHHSEEWKNKQSEKMKGRNFSKEHKRKMSYNHSNVKGEDNSNSILTEKDVIEIRKDLNEGILTQKEIGEKFGVSPMTISKIKTRRTWKHI